jgi:hypothetical protein
VGISTWDQLAADLVAAVAEHAGHLGVALDAGAEEEETAGDALGGERIRDGLLVGDRLGPVVEGQDDAAVGGHGLLAIGCRL